jgi:tetratricopeptide (TPR) repeat protein
MGMKVIVCFLFFYSSLIGEGVISSLSERALEAYQQGERSQTIAERNRSFNKALTLYTTIEEQGSFGEVEYNIANSYFQLLEYEKALLYYARSLKKIPREYKVQANFLTTLDKIKDPETWKAKRWIDFFSGKTFLTDKELLFWFVSAIIAFVVSWSFFIWLRKRMWRMLSLLFTLFFLCILSVFLCRVYLTFPEGVIMQNTMVYHDAGGYYRSVGPPLLSGSLIKVIERYNNEWLKVKLSDGKVGFILRKNLELI